MKYAAFVMTFKRTGALSGTIQKLRQQSLPPAHILIVDNDPDGSAELVAKQLDCGYYFVGHNSGPAGAAYWGLKILFEKGWEWVAWVDDDDPPVFDNVIENVFGILQTYPGQQVGMLGAVGVRFNRNRARIERIADNQLTGILEVDNVAGNMYPIVNRKVYEKAILPDKELFFGFEELDFTLHIRRKGFKILVSGEEIARHREFWGRTQLQKKIYHQKNRASLWREYYSTRNMLYILVRKEKRFFASFIFVCRSLLKTVFGYKYGMAYGSNNFSYVCMGLGDALLNRMGATVMPRSK